MAQIIKIRKMYYSDIRVACDGLDCPGPKKSISHFHRRRKALSTDKRFAEEKLADMVRIRGAAKRGEPINNISWEGFKERFLVHTSSKSTKSQYHYKKAFEDLEQAVPLTSLKSLTPERLEGFKGFLKNKGLALTTINLKLILIKAVINKAIEWKMLDFDPAYRKIKQFKVSKGRLHFFSLEEMATLLSKCRGSWKTMCVLGYYAGLRRAEMHTLKCSSVDFVRNRLHIEPTEEFIPKDKERRFIPMHPKLRDYLKSIINGHAYVLGEDRPTLDSMSAYFKRIIDKAGLHGSIHTLRHTFASHCAMSGIDVVTLSKYLGHSNTKTTEIYMHLSPTHIDQQILRLPEA